jgi:hypothetical protein
MAKILPLPEAVAELVHDGNMWDKISRSDFTTSVSHGSSGITESRSG